MNKYKKMKRKKEENMKENMGENMKLLYSMKTLVYVGTHNVYWMKRWVNICILLIIQAGVGLES